MKGGNTSDLSLNYYFKVGINLSGQFGGGGGGGLAAVALITKNLCYT